MAGEADEFVAGCRICRGSAVSAWRGGSRLELKGASAGAAEGRFQRKALPGVSPEREGERELLSHNSWWWISSREGLRVPCWLLPCLIF